MSTSLEVFFGAHFLLLAALCGYATAMQRIGVSNYELPHLEEMDGVPDVLQIEFHPWWNRVDLLQWCKDRNVQLVAYSSLGGKNQTESRGGGWS